ncbi:hypothetical protein SAMD00019534_097500 [Acytostelium subglobosum LB1]|uniref:hypothetical protein n=1 Tax=Acytostelium subglobosum LB1 TaxID=1410327 RepID=UPI000644BEC4|nr:hypothetical protein SAMD00019534_097500 [Acytostelium subglobosum LB1]GAM26575.1 hypothetical protein SAMD00019534_097500 [Acytostelium subglobosum LB1]|eukprot:XP_012750671.1 hypothetical protein SAMD00019534_097500 [Acytostelium subglobosum LB1]
MSTPTFNSNDSSPHSSPLSSKHLNNNYHNNNNHNHGIGNGSGSGNVNGNGHHPNKLFVGGISWRADEAGLTKYFSTFGPVIECKIIIDRSTLKSKGYGFVTFEKEDSVAKVKSASNLTYMGKNMNVGDAMRKSELVSMNSGASGQSSNGQQHISNVVAQHAGEEPMPMYLSDEEVPSNEMLEPPSMPYGQPGGGGYYVFYDVNGNVYFQQMTPPFQIFTTVPYHYHHQTPQQPQPHQQQQQHSQQQYLPPPQYYPQQLPPQQQQPHQHYSVPNNNNNNSWGRANQTVPSYIRSPAPQQDPQLANNGISVAHRPPPTTSSSGNQTKSTMKQQQQYHQSPDHSPTSTN